MRATERMVLVAFPEALFVSALLDKECGRMVVMVGIRPTKLQGIRIRIRTYIQSRMPYPTDVEFVLGSSRSEELDEGSQQAQVS